MHLRGLESANAKVGAGHDGQNGDETGRPLVCPTICSCRYRLSSVVAIALLTSLAMNGCSSGPGTVGGSGGKVGPGSGGAPTGGNSGGTIGGATGGTSGSGGILPGSGGVPAGSGGGSVETGGRGDGTGGVTGGTGGPHSATGGAGGSPPGTGGVGAPGGTRGGGGAGGQPTATGGNAAGGSNGGTGGLAAPAISKDAESKLPGSGVTIVSYGGYLNGESFQEEGILSFNGYQYVAFWNSARHVVVARRALPDGAWMPFELTDYTNTESDAHNTISLGICPGDGTLHLSFDHHGSTLHYRKSAVNLVSAPATAVWAASSFSAVTNSLVSGANVSLVTYPRFVTEPGGGKMLFDVRIGESGSGDEYLWEYDSASHAWTSLGRFLNGTADNINGYPHGLSYTRGGNRLHISWCWRETPDATTNHDLLYAYSDDSGRTWKNNAGATVATTGSSFLRLSSAGIKVWTINQNRGLINQEHMAVDGVGRVHVLLSHMPDAQANDSSFDDARAKSQYFHYWRDTDGTWTRTAMGMASVAAFRGKLAISSSGNVYAVLPDLRVAAAALSDRFATWTVVNSVDSGRFFSDPLIDAQRLLAEDKLSVFYPQKSSSNLWVLDYNIK